MKMNEKELSYAKGYQDCMETWQPTAKLLKDTLQAIQRVRKLADNFNLPENKDRTFTGEFVYLAIQDTLDSEQ